MKLKTKSSKCKTMVQSLKVLSFTLLLYTLHFTLYTSPVYAQVDIGEEFGFGGINDLGAGLSQLVMPGFSIAAFLVILYFLWGAFKYLQAGENKEEVSGAKQMISHAIVGFIILLFAFLVLQYLLHSLFKFDTGFNIFRGN